MNKTRGISELRDYGQVIIKVNQLMDDKQLNIYRMSKLTGLKYSTVKSYYTNAPLTRIDLDVLAKMCYVLDCEISDILEYLPSTINSPH